MLNPLIALALARQQPASPSPVAGPAITPGQPGASPSSDTLAALLGSVQAKEPHRTPLPATTFPEAPRSTNPEFTRLLLQTMLGAQSAPEMRSLAQLLAGR